MSLITFQLFGRFCVASETRTAEGLDARKAQELCCYLLLYRERYHPREVLASLLWDDISTAQSKTYLRKALWQLQTFLEAGSDSGNGSVLLVDPISIRINPQAAIWLDVAVFEQAFVRVRGVPGEQLTANQSQDLRAAIELYQGDLLEGWYQDWCLYERDRLQNIYLAMLDKLMGYCETQQEYEPGLIYGDRILRYDRAREQTYRRLMQLHYLAGDRTGALRQYERCVAALNEELGVEPTEYTTALYKQMRSNRLGHTRLQSDQAAGAGQSLVPSSDLLDHLKQLQSRLTDFQGQIQQSIQAVERVLSGRR